MLFIDLEDTMLQLSEANSLLPSDLPSFLLDVRDRNQVLECWQ